MWGTESEQEEQFCGDNLATYRNLEQSFMSKPGAWRIAEDFEYCTELQCFAFPRARSNKLCSTQSLLAYIFARNFGASLGSFLGV